eukprot:scaffold3058_cov309-Prasinococcus_capsulatus_cf.AAC.3
MSITSERERESERENPCCICVDVTGLHTTRVATRSSNAAARAAATSARLRSRPPLPELPCGHVGPSELARRRHLLERVNGLLHLRLVRLQPPRRDARGLGGRSSARAGAPQQQAHDQTS